MANTSARRSILVAEDEYFIAEDLARKFEEDGWAVVGPAATVSNALDLVEHTAVIDGAVLDINLQGDMVYLVAEALLTRGVPFVFATGYDRRAIPDRFAHIPRCEKPVEPTSVLKALFG